MISTINYLEEELNQLFREDQSVFKFFEEGSLDGVWYWDLNSKENEWMSPRFWTTLGYDPETKKHLASEWQNLIFSEDLEVALNNFERHCENPNHPYNQIVRYRHADGSTVWVRCRGIAIRDENGIPIRMLGLHTDLTALKQAEENLRTSENQFRTLYEQAPLSYQSLNAQGCFVEINQAWNDLMGYSRSEVIGHQFVEFLAAKEVEPFKQRFLKFIAAGEVHTDIQMVKRDGSEVTIHIDGRIGYGPDGDFKQTHCILYDITDRLELEEHIRKVQKMEAIGNLAGGIAHDFNNILFPIIGMSELLLEDLHTNCDAYEKAQEILIAGKRGRDLVKQILAFSRQSEHQVTPVRIQKILKEVLQLAQATIPSYIEISQNIPSDCGLVMADATQIHQVIMNIITNAFHAVEKNTFGKIAVELKEIVLGENELIDRQMESGRYAFLSISDNGHGMSSDLVNKIFIPYFTTKKEGKGTGLGLSVAYGIIKEHKGEIKVNSKLREGTTFSIYLPLMERQFDPNSVVNVDSYPTGKERILIVDDEESIARLEKQILERLGYEATVFLNSLDALQAFKTNPYNFDMVISDMNMPKMTGIELAKELIFIKPDIPIIVCSGFSERINKAITEKYGIKEFLMKPILRSSMAQMVRKVLDETNRSCIP
jgi:PAS domain S-box-containing protein